MAGLREKCFEERTCSGCNNVGTLVVSQGSLVCDNCGVILSERLVGESLEYASTHNAPLDPSLRTRLVRVNGRLQEIEVKPRWKDFLAERLTRMAHDEKLAIGEDVIKCAIGMLDPLGKLTEKCSCTGKTVRVFRWVTHAVKTSLLWALIQLAHDQCRIHTTLENLDEILRQTSEERINIKNVNAMVKKVRRELGVAAYCPDDDTHVSSCVKKQLMSDAGLGGGLDRRALCLQVTKQHRLVMTIWAAMRTYNLNSLRFKVKADPKMLTQVYHACVQKKKSAPRKARGVIDSLTAKGFDFNTLL